MSSTFAADLDHEQSLAAMWHALRASNLAGRNRVEIDAGVVPALLNARYYNPSQGQFISQDPVFLAIGDANKLQRLTGLDQQGFLSDPQLANSTSYARDNPITNKDPQGLWALRYGLSGTIPGWGLTGTIGVQADLQGLEYYYGAGLAGGGGFSLGPQISTADLSVFDFNRCLCTRRRWRVARSFKRDDVLSLLEQET
jgi:RHS repeat-associated protein